MHLLICVLLGCLVLETEPIPHPPYFCLCLQGCVLTLPLEHLRLNVCVYVWMFACVDVL